MILTHISLYLSIECINSLADFCTIFLLKMSFILSFYIYFTFIKCCTKYKIPKFIIPTLIHQLRNNFYIYITIKCIYTNYVVNIRHIRHLREICSFHLDFQRYKLVRHWRKDQKLCWNVINHSASIIESLLVPLDSPSDTICT